MTVTSKPVRMLFSAVSAALIAVAGASCQHEQPQPYTAAQQQVVSKANPQMAAVLEELRLLNPKPLVTISPEEARQQPTPADAVKQFLKKHDMSTSPEDVADIDMIKIPSDNGDVPARVYYPQGKGPFPVVVYFHGGGWVIGSLDAYDSSCRALVNQAQCVVVSVDYRLAPEHKFPAPLDDAYNATQYVMNHPSIVKGDAKRIAVAGESAGGNLAAAVCLKARDKGATAMLPMYQLLIYPVTNAKFDTKSYVDNADAVPLNKGMMNWFFDNYLSSQNDSNSGYVSVLGSDLHGLPPATVITASIDPLMSDGKQYADKLHAAGVEVMYRNFDGVTHEFFGMGAVVDEAKNAQRFAAAGLQSAFSK